MGRPLIYCGSDVSSGQVGPRPISAIYQNKQVDNRRAQIQKHPKLHLLWGHENKNQIKSSNSTYFY